MKTPDGILEFLINESIRYETSPIEILLDGQNLSEIELHAGIAFVEAKRLISDVNLLAPSSEYLSLLSVKSVVLPAFIATTNIQAN